MQQLEKAMGYMAGDESGSMLGSRRKPDDRPPGRLTLICETRAQAQHRWDRQDHRHDLHQLDL